MCYQGVHDLNTSSQTYEEMIADTTGVFSAFISVKFRWLGNSNNVTPSCKLDIFRYGHCCISFITYHRSRNFQFWGFCGFLITSKIFILEFVRLYNSQYCILLTHPWKFKHNTFCLKFWQSLKFYVFKNKSPYGMSWRV